jgi:hypothetical protein
MQRPCSRIGLGVFSGLGVQKTVGVVIAFGARSGLSRLCFGWVLHGGLDCVCVCACLRVRACVSVPVCVPVYVPVDPSGFGQTKAMKPET